MLYFKKARSGAALGILEQGGSTQCRKERHSAAFLSPRESPRWCTKKSRNRCCGFFAAPFPPGRTRTSRERSCSSRGDWSLKMLRRSIFLTRPLMVHQSTRCKKLQRVFYCAISRRHDLVQHWGYSNRAAARSAVRNATVRRSLARGRVPDGAPNNENPNLFSIGEGFGFFVFFGKQNEGSFPAAVCPKPYQKNRVTKVTTVKVP